ncbi:MAG: energy transducer TonB [Saprospiraceae bacterium]
MKRYKQLVENIFFLVIYACMFVSCTSQKPLTTATTFPATPKGEIPLLHYYVFKDGLFIEDEPDKKPVWQGGSDNIYPGMYQNIKYPAFAREHGIQGTVVITVTINELGQMEDAYVSRNVGGGCDEEALRVVKEFGMKGFEPAQMNGLPVKVRYDYPLKFVLQ